MMITDDHKQALRDLLKLVQSKMSGDDKEFGDVEMPEQPEGDEPEDAAEMQAEQITGEEPEDMDKGVQDTEISENGLDPKMVEDMKRTFGGREDLNMPLGKKGVRMGVTEISAIPMKKPMRR